MLSYDPAALRHAVPGRDSVVSKCQKIAPHCLAQAPADPEQTPAASCVMSSGKIGQCGQ